MGLLALFGLLPFGPCCLRSNCGLCALLPVDTVNITPVERPLCVWGIKRLPAFLLISMQLGADGLDSPRRMPVRHNHEPLLLRPAYMHAHLRVVHLDLRLGLFFRDVGNASRQVYGSILSGDPCASGASPSTLAKARPTLSSTNTFFLPCLAIRRVDQSSAATCLR